jgi:hypothetical protein
MVQLTCSRLVGRQESLEMLEAHFVRPLLRHLVVSDIKLFYGRNLLILKVSYSVCTL